MNKDYEVEYLRLQVENLQKQLQDQGQQDQQVDINDVKELVDMASEMRQILILCRKEQINISVAKRIDNILRRAKDFD